MLSILYVTGAFPVFSETFVTNEIRAMRALGHRVGVFSLAPSAGGCQPGDEPLLDEARATSAVAAREAMLLAARSPVRLACAAAFARAQRGLSSRSLLLAGARAAVAARRMGATHLHAHFALAPAATAIVAARLAGATCSFTGHGYDIYASPADLALKLRSADLAVAVCDDMRIDMLAEAPGARVRVVHCGVDAVRFSPAPAVLPRNHRLLFVGRIAPQKGIPTLLEAVGRIAPDARPAIDLVGGGAALEETRARVEALGLSGSVRLLGPRSASWIAQHGPLYTGFVAPYVIGADGARDTGPLTVKEAMAMGLPVVASSLMGLKEIVGEGGELVPPGDAEALAAALLRLHTTPLHERIRIGAAGRERVLRHFTLEAQARGLSDAIAKVSAR